MTEHTTNSTAFWNVDYGNERYSSGGRTLIHEVYSNGNNYDYYKWFALNDYTRANALAIPNVDVSSTSGVIAVIDRYTLCSVDNTGTRLLTTDGDKYGAGIFGLPPFTSEILRGCCSDYKNNRFYALLDTGLYAIDLPADMVGHRRYVNYPSTSAGVDSGIEYDDTYLVNGVLTNRPPVQ